jgi:PHP family Zn ribbon phosphoesterase
MRYFRADLHIHTILSPCGDLEMSPANIIKQAKKKGLDIIGIADHNSTRQAELVREMGEENGMLVLMGAEVNTKEEVHCLMFFDSIENLREFQKYLDAHLSNMKNDPVKFGDQVVIDRDENIVYVEDRTLFQSVNQSIEDVEKRCHELNGLFILAHVDRQKNSIYSQLGFIPDDLNIDAIEISKASDPQMFIQKHNELERFTILRSSDAHYLNDIGIKSSDFYIKVKSFEEIRMALKGIEGRKVIIS